MSPLTRLNRRSKSSVVLFRFLKSVRLSCLIAIAAPGDYKRMGITTYRLVLSSLSLIIALL
ncbi:MAG TPA: hypothetical protein VKB27_20065, partial [Gammaproteobacteria bacterium]|nr:hypothetical protein [Gammaproteobacteria bacterium]